MLELADLHSFDCWGPGHRLARHWLADTRDQAEAQADLYGDPVVDLTPTLPPCASIPSWSIPPDNCVAGIKANEGRIAQLLHESLMLVRPPLVVASSCGCKWRMALAVGGWCRLLFALSGGSCCIPQCLPAKSTAETPSPVHPPCFGQVTALNNKIGYDKAAAIAKKAHKEASAGWLQCFILLGRRDSSLLPRTAGLESLLLPAVHSGSASAPSLAVLQGSTLKQAALALGHCTEAGECSACGGAWLQCGVMQQLGQHNAV